MTNIYRPDEYTNSRRCEQQRLFATSPSEIRRQNDIILKAAMLAASGNNSTSRSSGRDTMRTNVTSLFEDVILNSTEPIEINECDEITIDGQSGILANKTEINEWKGAVPLKEYEINRDPNPEVINKKTSQQIDYVQELAFR